MALKQYQTLKHQARLSALQIQAIKMLAVPTMELEQRIKEEMEINPALEEGENTEDSEETELEEEQEKEELEDDETIEKDDYELSDYMDEDEGESYKTKANNTSPDEENKEIPFSIGTTFQESMESQLGMKDLNNEQYQIAIFLLGNLDDDGYLRRKLISIVDDIAFTQNISVEEKQLEEILLVIQELDPAGVGARDLQECLLLQLKRKHSNKLLESLVINLATEIIEKRMEDFSYKRYDKIKESLNIEDEELFKNAIHEITKLNPRPGNSMADGQKSQQQIIPDFTITNEEGALMLTLNSRNFPQLHVSKDYNEMLVEYSKIKDKKSKEASSFVNDKIEAANWFINAIRERGQTMQFVMNAIMNFQREYFITGDETKLKPMILKDIADVTGADPSTISRVTSSKYVLTPYGTFSLKSFFSESITANSGEEVSTREVKKVLLDILEKEDKKKPLNDTELAEMLKQHGFTLVRRTLAKYRDLLNIPPARLRREL